MSDCEFADWKKSHGFASDKFLMAESSRIGEAQITRKPVPVVSVSAQRDPELLRERNGERKAVTCSLAIQRQPVRSPTE
jgi:hypothetical protein